MRIALWGYYGTNYGDDIMLEVILNYFVNKNIDVELVDMYEGTLEYRFRQKYKNVKVIPFKNLSRIEKVKAIKDLAKANINLWGGGTIFTDTDGDGNFKWFSLIKLFGGKIGYVGVGLGKLTKPSRIKKTKQLLSWSSICIIRDKQSYARAVQLARNKNFYLAEDLSYIFLDNFKQKFRKNESQKYILLTWRNLIGYVPFNKEMDLMDDLVTVVEHVIRESGVNKVILGALDTKYDVDSCRHLYKKLKEKGINVHFELDSSVENLTKLIINSYLHFSGRLHGSIVSEFFKVPTITLSYSPKLNYFYESINSNGFIDIYNEKINFERVKEIIQNSQNNSAFEQKVEEAKLNFVYLDNYLDSN